MIDGILDTNIIIDLLHKLTAAQIWHSQFLATKRLCITPIVWFEIVSGVRSKQERRDIIRFLNDFRMEYHQVTDYQWAVLQFGNFSLSHGVEYQDTLIAAVAARLQVPLYTRNLKHMSVLPSVSVIKPY